MHEYAIVESLLYSLDEAIKNKGLREIRRLVVYVGELQSLDLGVIREAVSRYLFDLGVSFEDILVVEEKALFECNRCSFRWSFSSVDPSVRELIHFLPEAIYSFMRCHNCGSRDYSVKSGRVLRVKIEV